MKLMLTCFGNSILEHAKYLVHETRPIGMFIIGTVVQDSKLASPTGERIPKNRFGHIVGFSKDAADEVLLKIKWEDRFEPESVPPNIIIFHPS